jgi:hypothetical protein
MLTPSLPRGCVTMRTIVLATLLTFGGVGCNEPSDPPPIAEWADNTTWAGRVTMESGVVLDLRFGLVVERDGSIDLRSPSLESHFNGVRIQGFGSADPGTQTLSIIFFHYPEVPLDGIARTCLPQHQPYYYVDAALSPAGEFQGMLRHSCSLTSTPFGEWTIVLRRL